MRYYCSKRDRFAQSLPEAIMIDTRRLFVGIAIKDEDGTVRQCFNGNRVTGRERRGNVQRNTLWEIACWRLSCWFCIQRLKEIGSCGSYSNCELLVFLHVEIAIKRPVAEMLAIKNPDAAARSRHHIERYERHILRPEQLQWRLSSIEIED